MNNDKPDIEMGVFAMLVTAVSVAFVIFTGLVLFDLV